MGVPEHVRGSVSDLVPVAQRFQCPCIVRHLNQIPKRINKEKIRPFC